MNYEAFCQLLSEELLKFTEEGTILNRDTVLKNNGVSYDVFCLLRPDTRCSPVIKIRPLYNSYMAGKPMEKICEAVRSTLEAGLPVPEDVALSVQYLDKVRENIAFRLVSKDSNEELLKTVPWLPCLDLALIFFIRLESGPENHVTTLIRNEQAALWNLTANDLLSIAGKNMPRLFPASISRMDSLIEESAPGMKDLQPMAKLLPPLYVLTNQYGIYGAACILYKDIIKDFAVRTESDYLIFPSSIHEVLLFPDSGSMNYDYFCRMIREINREAVDREDFLSDELYLYTRHDNTIRIWPYDSSPDTKGKDEKRNP